MLRLLAAILSLFTALPCHAKKWAYTPGLDVSSSSEFAKVSFGEYYCPEDTSSACNLPNEAMGASSPGISIFFQKPLRSKFYLKIFDADYGLSFPITYQKLSTDRGKNTIGTFTYDANGNPVYSEAAVPIDMTLLGIQPSLYAQVGLTIPYLPWIILRLGLGPNILLGNMQIDKKEKVEFYSVSPGIYLELLLIPLRLARLDAVLYGRVVSSLREETLKVQKGEDRNYEFESASASFGLRLHFK